MPTANRGKISPLCHVRVLADAYRCTPSLLSNRKVVVGLCLGIYIVTYVIPFDKLQKPLQEKFRALHTEEAFEGVDEFDRQIQRGDNRQHGDDKSP
ncbi:hypothetical protein TNCV_3062781 [Trichonephila clavipes]|nr:hypothetical protein TNCV_3062781 [Trichonephila clavipes]